VIAHSFLLTTSTMHQFYHHGLPGPSLRTGPSRAVAEPGKTSSIIVVPIRHDI